MREQEFKARDKKVQKMSRDGLTEKNLAKGTEQNVSGRAADVSFARESMEDTEAGRHAGSRAQRKAGAEERADGDNAFYARNGKKGGIAEDAGKDSRRKIRERAEGGKRQAERTAGNNEDAENAAMREGRPHLHFKESEMLPAKGGKRDVQRAGAKKTGRGTDAEADKKEGGKLQRQKNAEKAEHREGKERKKSEKAKNKIPKEKHIPDYRHSGSSSGNLKRRLRFETEDISGKKDADDAGMGNTGLEAMRKAGAAMEKGAGRTGRKLREKPYREMRRAENKYRKAKRDTAHQKAAAKNPKQQGKSLSKWYQRKQLKRKYAEAARESAKGAQHTANVLNSTGQVVRSVIRKAAGRKTMLGLVAAGMLFASLFGALFTSCTAMLSGIESAVVATCYTAEDAEINRSELRYTELETDLQINIDSTEDSFPGYDEYRYSIADIGHNPYELMGYLSAAYGDFTYTEISSELQRLFDSQYQLVRTEITETRTYTDEDGEEQEYEWHVLQTTLSVRALSEVVAGSLAAGEQTDLYGVYMETLGNRQCYGSPFDFSWMGYVSSPYGYRVHPINGGKHLHSGIDIAVAAGTPVRALQDGYVASAGNDGGYGLCVLIEGEKGYCSRYAHCASLSVSAGQEVKRGDVIAAVGSTGSSTGPHLHLEVAHNGECLNPYYYVAGGGAGDSVGAGGLRPAAQPGNRQSAAIQADSYERHRQRPEV